MADSSMSLKMLRRALDLGLSPFKEGSERSLPSFSIHYRYSRRATSTCIGQVSIQNGFAWKGGDTIAQVQWHVIKKHTQ